MGFAFFFFFFCFLFFCFLFAFFSFFFNKYVNDVFIKPIKQAPKKMPKKVFNKKAYQASSQKKNTRFRLSCVFLWCVLYSNCELRLMQVLSSRCYLSLSLSLSLAFLSCIVFRAAAARARCPAARASSAADRGAYTSTRYSGMSPSPREGGQPSPSLALAAYRPGVPRSPVTSCGPCCASSPRGSTPWQHPGRSVKKCFEVSVTVAR